MSDAALESKAEGTEEAREPLTESEHHETRMTYGHGTMPWPVALVWVAALTFFVWYFVYYGVPDLKLWLRG